MRSFLFFLLCCSLVLCKYSYTDKCYRYGIDEYADKRFYQYYFNKNGKPLSRDYIYYMKSFKGEVHILWSFYYHHVLSDCQSIENGFNCTSLCESVWFKIWNVSSAGSMGQTCDKAFVHKYANVMEHSCNQDPDPLAGMKQWIGKQERIIIMLDGKEPVPPKSFTKQEKCIWEYNILGLWSIVTLIVVCAIVLVVLIILIGLIAFTQKHRANKRKRLEGSLVRSENVVVWFVCCERL